MSKTYYSVLTTYGAQLFAQAMTNRQQVRITQFAVGDGGGRAVQPDSARTSLVRQVHRANVSAVSTDPRNSKQVIFELTIPETVGGFWIREMGIYDANNKLVAYANCPDTYKPRLEEGSGKVQVVRMILLVSSSNSVTLTMDDSVIFVTRGQLTPKTITATSQNGFDDTGHTHQIDRASTTQAGIVQLDSSTDSTLETKAATPKAVKTVKDLADSNARSLQNVIPNSKKSNSVSSTSSDTVATSYAVKQAYDKGVSAQNSANSANNNANGRVSKLGDTMTGHLEIKASDWSAVKLWNTAKRNLILEVRPDSDSQWIGNFIYRTESGSNLATLNIPRKNGELAILGEVVRKNGDTMTGVLSIDRKSSYIVGKYGNQNKWYVGKGSDNSDNIRLHSYEYNYGVELQSNMLVSGKPIYINNDPVVYEKTDRITNLNSLTGSLFFKCDGTTTGMPSGWERSSDHNGFQVDGGWQRFQVVVQNENKIAIRVNDSNGDATSWSAWSELVTEGNFGQRIKILTGTIAHGGTIPLPAGFTERQCRWFVSPHAMHDDVSAKDIMFFQVSAENTRVVTCLVEGKVSQKSKASYIIIGVK